MLDKKKKGFNKEEKELNIDNAQNSSRPGKDKDLKTSKVHELRFAVEPDVILTKDTPSRHSKENDIRFAIEPGIHSISKEHELRFGQPDGRYNSEPPSSRLSKEALEISEKQLREHQWREQQLREYQLRGHQLRQNPREPSVRLSKLDNRASPWASNALQQKYPPPPGLYNPKAYEMATFDTCCCCSLRAGSTIIGLLSLVLSLGVGAALCLVMVAADLQEVLKSAYYTYHDLENPTRTYAPNGTILGAPEWRNMEDPELMYVELVIIAILIYMFCCTVVDSLLVIGAIWEKTYLLVPWMVVQWITIFLTIGIFGIILWHELVTMPRYWWAVMFVVGTVILMVLAFVVVLSLYQLLRDREYPEYYQGAELVHRHIWLSNQKGKYYE
ncbi:unnamed protein product [Meganyctiphanes norvegica]|uniref:Uncharacterized protein n=1 Tax=Meganyctiphanes norvegica TaxID=48144 RepID=A0AAV2PQ09_MEGNR